MYATSEAPFQFSLRTAFWTLGVATIGWRLFTSPVNPAVSVPIALTVHVVMLLLISRRPGIKSPARRRVIGFGWLMLLPFVSAGLFLSFTYLSGAERPGPVAAPIMIWMFILYQVSLASLPLAMIFLLAILSDFRAAFADDPRYCQPFLAACLGTALLVCRLTLDLVPRLE